MSWYWGFRYKGIVKEKNRRDIAVAFDKGYYSAIIDDELKGMIYALYPYVKVSDYYPGEETEFMEDITCFDGYCYKGGFEALMKSINKLYETKGIDAVLEELPHGSL